MDCRGVGGGIGADVSHLSIAPASLAACRCVLSGSFGRRYVVAKPLPMYGDGEEIQFEATLEFQARRLCSVSQPLQARPTMRGIR